MNLDDAIGQVSQLYRTVTGHDMPRSEAPYAPIPAERDPVQHVNEQLDRLVGFLAGTVGGRPQVVPFAPPIAIYETTSDWVVALDVPGTTRDRIDVHLESGLLVVSGQRAPALEEGERVRHAEVCFGMFRRVVPLPPALRTNEMSARLEQGVLEVRIPRDGANGVRQVAVS